MASKKVTPIFDRKRYDYGATKFRNSEGRLKTSRGTDDAVARALINFVAAGGDLMKVVRDNGLADKYKGRDFTNQGLMRMAIGNSLRALVRNKTPVVIGDLTVKSLGQRVAIVDKVEAKPAAGKARKKVKARGTRKRKSEAAAA